MAPETPLSRDFPECDVSHRNPDPRCCGDPGMASFIKTGRMVVAIGRNYALHAKVY